MPSYDEDEEQYDPAVEAFTPIDPNAKPTISINIDDFRIGALLNVALQQQISVLVRGAVDKFVEKAVKKALNETIASVTKAAIEEQVRKHLTDGWVPTNQWGEPQHGGKPMTLGNLVRDELDRMMKPNPHAYHADEKLSPVSRVVQQFAQAAVKEGLEPVLAEAKKAFQSQLEVSMGKSLRLTLADALKG
jgi:hypothetical protein